MSKANAATSKRGPLSPAGKQGAAVAGRKPRTLARPTTTQDLIAHIWDTLEWRRTLQAAFIIAVTGVAATLVLAGLALAARSMTIPAAALPAAASLITVTVTYRAARRRRR